MLRLLTLPLRRFGAAATLLASLIAARAHAAQDTTAQTDDHSVNVPTAWWTYNNLSPQQLADKVAEHGARVVGLEVAAVTNAGESPPPARSPGGLREHAAIAARGAA